MDEDFGGGGDAEGDFLAAGDAQPDGFGGGLAFRDGDGDAGNQAVAFEELQEGRVLVQDAGYGLGIVRPGNRRGSCGAVRGVGLWRLGWGRRGDRRWDDRAERRFFQYAVGDGVLEDVGFVVDFGPIQFEDANEE